MSFLLISTIVLLYLPIIALVDAYYINGFQDMEIYIIANNGVLCVDFTVNEDAFRDKKVMENKLKEALK